MRFQYLIPIVLLGLSSVSSAEVRMAQTTDAITLSNGTTTLTVQMQEGRTNAFRLIDAAIRVVLTQIEIGGLGRWTAMCSAESNGRVGSIRLSLDRHLCDRRGAPVQ